jgi:predicted HD phosphohydrolase
MNVHPSLSTAPGGDPPAYDAASGETMLDGIPRAGRVADVLSLLCESSPETSGEEAFLLDHSLQCAAIMLAEHPDDLELQIAGLLHDVGHQLTAEADLHGVAGAVFVRPLFGDRVADLVELHVEAKRYLVAVDPQYRSVLSAESLATLDTQGGALDDPVAIEAFSRHPLCEDAVALRRADEAAKVWGRKVPGLDRWIPVLESVAGKISPPSPETI